MMSQCFKGEKRGQSNQHGFVDRRVCGRALYLDFLNTITPCHHPEHDYLISCTALVG
jgi:hypothetical protein